MQIEWDGISGEKLTAPVREPILSFVEALGLEAAVAVFQRFGGVYVYIRPFGSNNPAAENSALYEFLNGDQKRRLAERFGTGSRRIPLAKMFVARCLRAKGSSVREIALELNVSDVTARNFLASEAARLGRNAASKQRRTGAR